MRVLSAALNGTSFLAINSSLMRSAIDGPPSSLKADGSRAPYVSSRLLDPRCSLLHCGLLGGLPLGTYPRDLSPRQHIAHRFRIPPPTARRRDPACVQGV